VRMTAVGPVLDIGALCTNVSATHGSASPISCAGFLSLLSASGVTHSVGCVVVDLLASVQNLAGPIAFMVLIANQSRWICRG
jgi:hypothetical protein